MEPTLDDRLGDLLLAVRRTRPPAQDLVLQTNGILLHRHDQAKLADAQVNVLSVSIDSADPQVHKSLRGGTSLDKVTRNIGTFRASCPSAEVHFITTVTRLNLPTLEHLVRVGLELGVSRFILREVFYHPEYEIADRARMPELVLRPGEYAAMAARLQAEFGSRAAFLFADETFLEADEKKILADSLRSDV
jgi:MoaA/NifB/PqqE/SkfB family radical SAM enzyme